MKTSERRHIIDFLVPLALFFAFALSALIVILFATRVYKNTVEASEKSYTSRTAVSYLTEKIHAGDTAESVTVGTFDGYEALLIHTEIEGEAYMTAVYLKDGQLNEQFMKEGAETSADAGTAVLDLTAFSVREAAANLFKVECTDAAGHTETAYIAVRSR